MNAYLWIRNIFGVGVLSLYLHPTATTLQYNLTCAFSPSHLSVWPPLTHTDRQTNRQTHWCTHIYSSLLVKLFEGNIIHYNMQLPCNALATNQSFNSFQSCRVRKTCAHWPMQVNAPLRLTKRCKRKMLLEKVITKHSSCAIELFFLSKKTSESLSFSFFLSSFFLKLYCL